jgi:exopolyphosphatase / guanosine-5'-triphosphate,3'-diphosphate pyrophosphatase
VEPSGVRCGAIDIGTVTTRLLVADVLDGCVTEVVRRTIITHLGEGLAASGRLSDDAMARVTGVVQGFVRDCAEAGCERTHAVATSASRDAANGTELMARLDKLGAMPEIISGGREARLSFLGATYGLEDDDILVADIGGGSTELVFGGVRAEGGLRDVDIDAARSIDVGARRLTDLYLHSDPPRRDELDSAFEWVTEQLRPFFDSVRQRPRCLLALAGTATSLAAIHLGLGEYDMAAVNGSKLSGPDVMSMRDELARMTLEQRRAIPSLDPGRAPVIVAGAMILETVLALAGLDQLTVSEHDILYGMVLTLAEEA